MSDRFEQLRLIEALLFASAEPLGAEQIRRHLPEDADLDSLLSELQSIYANRGVNLVSLGDRWALRTAPDLAPLMQIEKAVTRKPSRAAVETLAIIAYHQPVTRAEIEEIRGVALSRGTLDTLLEAGWIRPRGRRRTPGRPVTWGTTGSFLDHFGLESLDSLPGVAELKAAGLLDTRPALTALGARGQLPKPGEATEDIERDEDEEEDALPLAPDFGEDLLADDGEEPDENEENADDAPRAARKSSDVEAAGPEEAARPRGNPETSPPKAAQGPGARGD